MNGIRQSFGGFLTEIAIVSGLYFGTTLLNFKFIQPLQNSFFPHFASHASLLFLPHGVRVLSAWLLGWRSALVLFPGVFLAFLYVGGAHAFQPSRISAMLVAVTIAPAVFSLLKFAGWDLYPATDKTPCWPCVMLVGIISSVCIAVLTNLALGTSTVDYVAYMIGDISGLFFLMLILMYAFRAMRARGQ